MLFTMADDTPTPDTRMTEVGAAAVTAGGPTGAGTPTYRGRVRDAAAARGIPIATIATTVVVAVLVLDINALAILLLWVLRTVILYIVVATFVALLLTPVVHRVQRTGLSRGWAVVVVFMVALVLFAGLISLFTPPLVSAVGRFAKNLPTLVSQAEHGRGRFGVLLKRFHLLRLVQTNAPKISKAITNSLKPAQALSVGAAAFSTLIALGTIAVLSLFILLEMPTIRRGFVGLLSPARGERFMRVYYEASHSVTGYVFGDALTSIIAGVVIFVTLIIVGVPYAALLGVWVALVDLLPLVGGLLAGVPVAVFALIHSVPAFVVVVIVFIAYQQVENHVLNPVIMSRTVRLNPLWVLLSVLIAATLGARISPGLGTFVGALIGIPIGGALQVVFRELRKGPTAAPEGAEVGAGDPEDGDHGAPAAVP